MFVSCAVNMIPVPTSKQSVLLVGVEWGDLVNPPAKALYAKRINCGRLGKMIAGIASE